MNEIAIFVGGFLLGVISTWVLIHYGFKLGSRTLYEQKENLPPGEKAIEMEQANTFEYEEE